MRCLICGQLSLSGAKLCLDCKAARQRAFDATVTQPLLARAGAARGAAAPLRLFKPSQPVPDAARRAAKMALAAQAQSNIATDSPPGRAGRWPIIVAAIGIVLVVFVVISPGHWFGASKSDTFAAVPIEPAAPHDSPAASIAGASTPRVALASAAATVPAVANPAAVLPQAAVTKADATARPNARQRPEKAPITLPPPELSPPPVVAIERPPPPRSFAKYRVLIGGN
jgi:hypothetical protein